MRFSLARPNPGKRSTENFTKFSRQISRHLWQRKTEKNFTSALLQGSCSKDTRVDVLDQNLRSERRNIKFCARTSLTRGGLRKLHARTCRADFPFPNSETPVVHNSVCSQFLEGLLAILAECSQFCLRSF